MQPTHQRLRRIAFGYAILYFLFVAAGTIPATRSAIFSNPDLPSFALEQALVFILFALFLAALIVWSRTESGAGVLLLIWYALVVWMDAFSTRYGMGGGAGPVIGAPGILIGLFLVATSVISRLRTQAAMLSLSSDALARNNSRLTSV